jgi:ketosteroid isomerase-like protein
VADDPAATTIAEVFELFDREVVGREDLERLCDPDIRHITRFAALEGREYRGYQGIEEFLADSRRQFERFHVEIGRIVGEGDRRVAVYHVEALTRDTRVPISQRLGMEIELRSGRLWRTKVYADPREALEAAGLDPSLA